MSGRKTTLALSLLLVAALSACNLPSEQGTPTPDPILTVTALAQALATPTPTLVSDTPTPEFSPTPAFTPTSSVPTITVSVNTNCRTGPGVIYDLNGGLNVGQTAEVVGKNSAVANYWVVRLPGGTICWLWGQYATVSGNTANLPEYPVPPTPTPSPTPTPTSTPTPPAAVSNLVAAKACAPVVLPIYQYGGAITWQDNSNNEDGFNIYLNNALHGSVGANVTAYGIPPLQLAAGTPITLSVEAYNAGGKSAKVDVVVICP
jgi:hypothetical protein